MRADTNGRLHGVDLDTLDDALDGARPTVRATRTLADMLTDDTLTAPLRYLLPGILPMSACSLIYGRGKSGKSTWCAHLALHVASGRPFLGRSMAPGSVLWLDLEQGPRLWLRNMRAALDATGVPADALAAVHYDDGAGLDGGRVADVLATVEATRPALVIVDSMVRWLRPEDENDNGEWARRLDPVVRAAQAGDAAWLIIDHARKGDGQHGDALRGAGAKLDAVDVAVHLHRLVDGREDTPRRRLDIVSRYDGDRRLTVELGPDGYREVDAGADVRAAVLGALAAGPATLHEVQDQLRLRGIAIGRDTIRARLVALGTEGHVTRTKRPPRQGGDLFTLADNDAAPDDTLPDDTPPVPEPPEPTEAPDDGTLTL